jgi:hypothetical protein
MDRLKNIGIGALLILLGVLIIWYTSKEPVSRLFSIKSKGYISGITFIIGGIIYILNKLQLW